MNENSDDSSLMQARPPLRLIVKYVGPSRSNLENRHWTMVRKEKLKAFNSLSLALRDAERDSSMTTTLREVSKTCRTALDMHILSATTLAKRSGLSMTKDLFNQEKNHTP